MNMQKSKEQQMQKKDYDKKQILWEETQERMHELYPRVKEIDTGQVDHNVHTDHQFWQ